MQRGIGAIIILIAIAVLIGVSAIAYGYFVVSKGAVPGRATKQAVELPPEHLIPSPQPQVGTTECPDTDYTGCDNSSLYMTWDESDVQVTDDSSNRTTLLEK